ncbi:expressed unknown protein [Seminavis robusta]|uniref:AP2/ERF domain-containing protein n=1 Tax=Seminavis robusta TaxID=568900 RepID=A0A9N8EG85_9STRA|nr:expressed unknown protein [Seminavis robusta]|eukprot:Sro1151_g246760.1 n/a (428) ;mRNA; f:21733-23218
MSILQLSRFVNGSRSSMVAVLSIEVSPITNNLHAALAYDFEARKIGQPELLLNFPDEHPAAEQICEWKQIVHGESSQYRGVTYDKQSSKWRAQIRNSGSTCYLGSFLEEKHAALAYYFEARKSGLPEHKLNFPNEHPTQEQIQLWQALPAERKQNVPSRDSSSPVIGDDARQVGTEHANDEEEEFGIKPIHGESCINATERCQDGAVQNQTLSETDNATVGLGSALPMFLVGTRFRRTFDGHGTFEGVITSFDGTYYHVVYPEDGDEEDFSEEDLEALDDIKILPASNSPKYPAGTRFVTQLGEDNVEGIIQSFNGTHYNVCYPGDGAHGRLMEYEFEMDRIQVLSPSPVHSSAARGDYEESIRPDGVTSRVTVGSEGTTAINGCGDKNDTEMTAIKRKHEESPAPEILKRKKAKRSTAHVKTEPRD